MPAAADGRAASSDVAQVEAKMKRRHQASWTSTKWKSQRTMTDADEGTRGSRVRRMPAGRRSRGRADGFARAARQFAPASRVPPHAQRTTRDS